MTLLEEVQQTIGRYMELIVGCFKPGARITVIVRMPGFPDQDFCMTSDDPQQAIALLERRIKQASQS